MTPASRSLDIEKLRGAPALALHLAEVPRAPVARARKRALRRRPSWAFCFACVGAMAPLGANSGCIADDDVSVGRNVAATGEVAVTEEVGSGIEAVEERDIADATRLDVRGAFDVHISHGDEPTATVRADDNLLDEISVRNDGSSLVVAWSHSDASQIVTRLPVTIELTLPEFYEVAGSAAARIIADALTGSAPNGTPMVSVELSDASALDVGEVAAARASLVLRSGSTLTSAEVSTEELSVDTAGAAQLQLASTTATNATFVASGASLVRCDGLTRRLTLRGSDASVFRASLLQADEVQVELYGGSRAEVVCNEQLMGELRDASTLEYTGSPNVQVESSSGSSITRAKP